MLANLVFLSGIVICLGSGFYYEYQYFHTQNQKSIQTTILPAQVLQKGRPKPHGVSKISHMEYRVQTDNSPAIGIADPKRNLNSYLSLKKGNLPPLAKNPIYGAVLSDRELIGNALEMLLQNKNLSRRNDHVSFLIQAMKWRDNPCHVLVCDALEKAILKAKMQPHWTEAERRSWVGDQIQLYMALLELQPKRAHEVMKRAKVDDSLHKMLTYATNYYNNQKRRGIAR